MALEVALDVALDIAPDVAPALRPSDGAPAENARERGSDGGRSSTVSSSESVVLCSDWASRRHQERQSLAARSVGLRGRWGIVWTLGAMLASLASQSGCGGDDVEEKARAIRRVYIEDFEPNQQEGRYVHEFTMVNGNNLPITSATVRFHYSDHDGHELGKFDVRLDGYLNAHDAVRKVGIDGGPLVIRGDKVTHTVTKVRTTLVRPKE